MYSNLPSHFQVYIRDAAVNHLNPPFIPFAQSDFLLTDRVFILYDVGLRDDYIKACSFLAENLFQAAYKVAQTPSPNTHPDRAMLLKSLRPKDFGDRASIQVNANAPTLINFQLPPQPEQVASSPPASPSP